MAAVGWVKMKIADRRVHLTDSHETGKTRAFDMREALGFSCLVEVASQRRNIVSMDHPLRLLQKWGDQ